MNEELQIVQNLAEQQDISLQEARDLLASWEVELAYLIYLVRYANYAVLQEDLPELTKKQELQIQNVAHRKKWWKSRIIGFYIGPRELALMLDQELYNYFVDYIEVPDEELELRTILGFNSAQWIELQGILG